MNIIDILEIIGIIAFSISGALVAMEEGLDLFGIYVLSLITAVGGGATRDVVMDLGIPGFFSSYLILIITFTTATLTILLRKQIKKLNNVITFFDAIGLSVFAIGSGMMAINLSFNFPTFVFCAIITGVGGGIYRDLLCKRVPVVLRKEVYAMAALIGTIFLWCTYSFIGLINSAYISILIIFLIRIICVKYGVHLPVFIVEKGDNK